MIIKYYYGEERVKIENRQKLAEELGISSKTLVVRALDKVIKRFQLNSQCSLKRALVGAVR